MGKQRKTWSAEVKEQIVLSVLRGELSTAEAARQHGVNESLVHTWKANFLDAGRARLAGERQHHGHAALEWENDRLKRIVAEKELELDISRIVRRLTYVRDDGLRQSRSELSLRRFARYAGVSYWQLRDFAEGTPKRDEREQVRGALREQVKQVALLQPTYGYRFLYRESQAQGEQVGLHRVRELLGELGLNPPPPRKTRKPSPAVVAPPEWPTGRRVQIDASRLLLADGCAGCTTSLMSKLVWCWPARQSGVCRCS